MSITPKLYLDFLNESLDPRITFTRAGATATRVNENGLIETVAADTPRFDFSNGVCGLLIEEERTNLLINSVFPGAVVGTPGTPPTSWTNGATTGEITEVSSASYVSGFALTFSCIAQRRTVFQTISVAANTTYAVSAIIEGISGGTSIGNHIGPVVWPAGTVVGQFFLNGVAVNPNATLPLGVNKVSFLVSTSGTAGTGRVTVGVGVNGNGTAVSKISNVQAEAGAFQTSYIPTTATALTRNADVATITGTNFSDFWQATRGGASVLATPSNVSGIRPLVQFDDNTANNIIALRGNAANPELQIVDGGAPQVQLDAGTIFANTPYSLTGWWQTNDCKARQNSGATVSDYTATIPTVTQARLGSDGTNYLNGHLATINYYDRFTGQIYDRRKNKAVFSLL